MAASDHLNPQQFFHGTTETIDHVLPQAQHGGITVWPQSSSEHAYATTNSAQAYQYSQGAAARVGGIPRVYRVEPMGHYEADPQSPDSFRSKVGWRVLGRE